MKFSRRSFLKSVAAVAAVTAAGIALPSVTAVEAMIEPEVHAKIYPATVVPSYAAATHAQMMRFNGTTFVWEPFAMIGNGVWKPTSFPHPFRGPDRYALATGRDWRTA